jgi:hypothetical protein
MSVDANRSERVSKSDCPGLAGSGRMVGKQEVEIARCPIHAVSSHERGIRAKHVLASHRKEYRLLCRFP